MHYLLVAIGALAVAVLLWRMYTAERVGVPAEKRRPARPLAPDDDPEFLRKLAEQTRKNLPEDKDK
ncbi:MULTISPECIES: hypothetical protein [Thermocrispum]|jgi:hypothetical protein|uniref:Uncharacterized protein n=1 Tax=Thermocrispum agreste TaxID=37925 RepID=A0A2W4JBQ5_9PSEU|nr:MULTISPECIES: hypothetical protein [Thermocrispum]PZM95851.1 MAG: hypothetical protein DIU77_11740 [Thermocrispum agreste]